MSEANKFPTAYKSDQPNDRLFAAPYKFTPIIGSVYEVSIANKARRITITDEEEVPSRSVRDDLEKISNERNNISSEFATLTPVWSKEEQEIKKVYAEPLEEYSYNENIVPTVRGGLEKISNAQNIDYFENNISSELATLIPVWSKKEQEIKKVYAESLKEYSYNKDIVPISEESVLSAKKFLQSLIDFKLDQELIKNVEIGFEDDGYYCFDWFQDDHNQLSISVHKDEYVFSGVWNGKRSFGYKDINADSIEFFIKNIERIYNEKIAS